MTDNDNDILGTLVPFELDAITGENVSPEKLPQYGGQARLAEIDQAYEMLDKADTSELFYKAVAMLVFHARHLNPIEHAKLAKLIFRPFQRPAGRPVSIELRDAIEEFVFWRSLGLSTLPAQFSRREEERAFVTGELAQRFSTSKKVVNRILLEAEEAVKYQKK